MNKELNTPKDLEIGTILVEGYANMVAFYRVTGTTDKTVVMQQLMLDTYADPDGYPNVGVRPGKSDYPDKPKRKVVHFLKDGGFWIPGPIDGHSMSIYNPNQHYSCYWD